MPDVPEITHLLNGLDGGNRDVVDRLVAMVYPELEAMAQQHLRGERADHTLDTAALVHEAYLKLAGQSGVAWQNRSHFFGIAALTMRRILITYAHARKAQKRGGGVETVTLIDGQVGREVRPDELIALDEALTRLAAAAERPARVVEMWFFGGLTQAEIAEALDISEATVRRDWRVARAWLTVALSESDLPHAPPA